VPPPPAHLPLLAHSSVAHQLRRLLLFPLRRLPSPPNPVEPNARRVSRRHRQGLSARSLMPAAPLKPLPSPLFPLPSPLSPLPSPQLFNFTSGWVDTSRKFAQFQGEAHARTGTERKSSAPPTLCACQQLNALLQGCSRPTCPCPLAPHEACGPRSGSCRTVCSPPPPRPSPHVAGWALSKTAFLSSFFNCRDSPLRFQTTNAGPLAAKSTSWK
jgi:hypothetical protein